VRSTDALCRFFLISLCKCPVITYKLQTHEAYTSESICPFNVSALGLACRLRKPNKRGRWSRSCVYIHLSPQVTFSGLGHFKKYHKRMQGTIHRKVVIMPSFSSSKRADTVKLAISGTLAAQLTAVPFGSWHCCLRVVVTSRSLVLPTLAVIASASTSQSTLVTGSQYYLHASEPPFKLSQLHPLLWSEQGLQMSTPKGIGGVGSWGPVSSRGCYREDYCDY
jgi:hypothetical protein